MGSQRNYYPLDSNNNTNPYPSQQQQSQQQYAQTPSGQRYHDRYGTASPSQQQQPPSSPYHDHYGSPGGPTSPYSGGGQYGTPRGGGASSGGYHDQQESSGYFSPLPDPSEQQQQQQQGRAGDVGLMNDYGEPHLGPSASNTYLGGSGGTAQYGYSPAASQVNLTSGDGDSAWDGGRSSNVGTARQYAAGGALGASKLGGAGGIETLGYSDAKDPYDQQRASGLAKYAVAKNASRKKKAWILFAVAVVVLCLAGGAVAVVYELVLKKKHPGPGQALSPDGTVVSMTGGDGSLIDLGNGTTFTYNNTHGGFWVSDPLNNSAQAQSYTPPLSEEFDFVKNRILGVNLGSWLVTEPFLAPGLYEPYENNTNGVPYTGNKITGDEYALCAKWIQEGGGGVAGKQNAYNKIKEHYDTYITEKDFAEIAGAGLNWIRLPIGFWAVETYSDEPFVEGLSWQYFLKAIEWARKYGLRINLDLHAVPGSQNGYNHSGKGGTVNFLMGPMGYANAQRTLNVIRTIAEFISQPTIQPVVPMFSVLNEPLSMSLENLQSFMGEVYTTIRNMTDAGKGNGPIITMHDGFQGFYPWRNFMRNSDRVFYDDHPYECFGPADGYKDWDATIPAPCGYFAGQFDQSLATNGMSIAGEFSLALADCSLWLNNVGQGARYDGTYLKPDGTPDPQFPKVGECGPWDDWWTYNSTMKSNINKFALAQMDAYKNWFFWNWKTGVTGRTGRVANPLWSYQLGIQEGWMPKNPNSDPKGACKSLGKELGVSTIASTTSWKTTFSDWQTGGAKSYDGTPDVAWPPKTMGGAGSVTDLPSYTQTGSVQTMPTPTATVSLSGNGPPDFGSGWFDAADTAGWYTPIAGCKYPSDAYNVEDFSVGANWPCKAARGRRSPVAMKTQRVERSEDGEEMEAKRRNTSPAPTPAPVA